MDEFKHEEEVLEKVKGIIKRDIEEREANCQRGIDEVKQLSQYHWDNKSEMDYVERINSRRHVNNLASVTNEGLNALRKLRKALDNPYVGKIIYEVDDSTEELYIGLTTIMEEDIEVVDWKSPVAELFYKSKIGKTSYKAPGGVIECDLKGRKQIKIVNGELKRVIDTKYFIEDEMLQEVLNLPTTDKMKTIIGTIQEEQNEIIRNVRDKNIIVAGCAGSGKTSVALHRLSFLLYADKKSDNSNMLVLSPSDIFSSYISDVLPNLGEQNVLQTTFTDFIETFTKGFETIESFRDFISKYYDRTYTEEENKKNKIKCSKEFAEALDKFITRYSNSLTFSDDVYYKNRSIPQSTLNFLYKIQRGRNALEKLDGLVESLRSSFLKEGYVIDEGIMTDILKKALLKQKNPKTIYNEFLKSDEFVSLYGKKDKIEGKSISYPDVISMLYLYFELYGYPENTLIHHLVVDEVQDYSILQMKMIKNLFRGASITFLGDTNQRINPYFCYESLKELQKVFPSSKYYELNKAYRSSTEIMEYSKQIINDDRIIPVRNQSIPIKKKEVSKKELVREIVEDIDTLKKDGLQRLCIITKSAKERDALYEVLKDVVPDIKVISKDKDALESTHVLSTSYDSKGLEFDAVISYNDLDNPYEEEEKYLYFVASTRAEHCLIVINEPEKVMKLDRKK